MQLLQYGLLQQFTWAYIQLLLHMTLQVVRNCQTLVNLLTPARLARRNLQDATDMHIQPGTADVSNELD